MYSTCDPTIHIHPGGDVFNNNMVFYVFCTTCGRQIGKVYPGTKTEQMCPKCGATLDIEVVGTKTVVDVLKQSDKVPAELLSKTAKKGRGNKNASNS